MELLLKDLKHGDEFEYVNTAPGYRKGNFLVLDTMGSYLRRAATLNCRFLFSFAAKKVVNHFVGQEIILKKFANEVTMTPSTESWWRYILKLEIPKSEDSMNHFIDWKFGVPVKIWNRYDHVKKVVERRLIWETDHNFSAITKSGSAYYYAKDTFTYELIPYAIKGRRSFRYPICENNEYTAFCNSSDIMAELDRSGGDFRPKRRRVAKLVLEDGTEIKLSDETTANLRKKLGV